MRRPQTVEWKNGAVRLIDQTLLPHKLKYIDCRDIPTLVSAIRQLKVRGAPAIGVAAAYGVLLAAKQFDGKNSKQFLQHVNQACKHLAASRPTAVNLFYALKRMQGVIHPTQDVSKMIEVLEREANLIAREDQLSCRTMGDYGAGFIQAGGHYLTVCNAGALATVDYGTALGVFYSAQKQGKKFKVYSCETRPLLQGARLTTWELLRSGIDTTLICDNMAATVMKQGKIDGIFVGADRIAANGDAANKIGTYMLAVLANHHKIPFYVVAPRSTFDLSIKDGSQIPIEERSADEVKGFGSLLTAPQNVKVYNPAFDVTEAKLITAIVTERGIIHAPNRLKIKVMMR